MSLIMKKLLLATLILLAFNCNLEHKPKGDEKLNNKEIITDYWQWKPFVKVDSVNPILTPNPNTTFLCPIRNEEVRWQEKDVFNPSAIVMNGEIHLVYRAEDIIGKHNGTSRLGVATSNDGLHFKREPTPVFYPDHDEMKTFEWEGGCEDPRIVETEDGRYILTYTSYDGHIARLCLASSMDLRHWVKHGLVLGSAENGKYRDLWSKSGSIICRNIGEKLIATKIKNKYWMYWGDTDIFLATSEDLINWDPVLNEDGSIKTIFGPRKGYFDSDLVEPGPPAIITSDGIWMIYNSRNHADWGDSSLPEGTYAAGQILFDLNDPEKVLARAEGYFFVPENDYEITGQVGNVCFVEALVPYKGKWFLYYGTADSKIAVAVLNN
jgi:predicted GH43/DUF377 family glycosyl hydrolase